MGADAGIPPWDPGLASLLGAEQEADELQTREDPSVLADLLPGFVSCSAEELFKWSFYCASFPNIQIRRWQEALLSSGRPPPTSASHQRVFLWGWWKEGLCVTYLVAPPDFTSWTTYCDLTWASFY